MAILRSLLLPLLLSAAVITLAAKQSHQHASTNDDDDATPTPTPAHHHKHASPSPTTTPSPNKDSDDDSDTPAPTPKHSSTKHHASPTPSEADSDQTPSPTPTPHPNSAPDATIDSSQLQDFSRQPERIRALIESSLDLTRQNLTYTFSSADPANGGMDCSGFIYYVLTQAGLGGVPRDASGQYSWLRKAGKFRAVVSRRLDGFEMDDLKPGDLLFWVGTYDTQHDPPVSHTMIYLGREKATGARVMVGSSDGRSYQGQQRWGVSVFDFKESTHPSTTHPYAQFIGYGSIPGL